MSFKKCFGAAGLILLLGVLSARADIKPHALISDGMVLQQGEPGVIWGTGAAPNEDIAVKLTGTEKPVPPAKGTVNKDGTWKAVFLREATQTAGGPYSLTIEGKGSPIKINEVYIGEVWVCSGQSNMEMHFNASANADEDRKRSANEKIRLFTVPHVRETTPQTDINVLPLPKTASQTDIKGKWLECGPNTVGNFSAVAYFFGRDLQKARNVPIGLINTSVGATAAEEWTSNQVLNDSFKELAHDGSKLYNGMIAPLTPFAIKGVIWYQGESNASSPERADQYAGLFPALIKDWRKHWNQPKLPFLFVQLAPFMKKEAEPTDTDTAWACLREAQRQTNLKVPDTAMAVIIDVGDEKDIHPRQKEPVGVRLALAARAVAYGEKIEYAGPVYDKAKFEGGKAIISFKNVGGGLIAKDGDLTGFTIAGEDRHFVNASAVIQGDNKVIVSSPKIAQPKAVRFGWANYPQVNLWNKDNLPASPFRTDDWPMVGKKK